MRFRTQIHQAAGFHQECHPHLKLPSWFIFLLPRFTLQLIPPEKHISKLGTDSEGFEIKWFNLTDTSMDNDNNNDDDKSSNTFSITLVDFQLDAQNSYLFIYNTFIKILYMFQALPCSSSGGLRHNFIYAASGIITL
jgi:hypothetical protein